MWQPQHILRPSIGWMDDKTNADTATSTFQLRLLPSSLTCCYSSRVRWHTRSTSRVTVILWLVKLLELDHASLMDAQSQLRDAASSLLFQLPAACRSSSSSSSLEISSNSPLIVGLLQDDQYNNCNCNYYWKSLLRLWRDYKSFHLPDQFRGSRT